ncbi:MAG: hypothetical protein SFV23_01100 [Planctomycetaceae bacterium]|nr:hypothetical protein [Planctomycetaceae bacterium]
MHIGIDLDNTLVCYDHVIHDAAVARGLIPRDFPARKDLVRNELRSRGQEAEWTMLQGWIYGPGMQYATPFAGAVDVIRQWVADGHRVSLVSHKSRLPFAGPAYDLHDAARRWLESHQLLGTRESRSLLDVHLELTKSAKLRRIAAIGCDGFIDDLPEILTDAEFPPGVSGLLFDPGRIHAEFPGPSFADWTSLSPAWLAEGAPQ